MSWTHPEEVGFLVGDRAAHKKGVPLNTRTVAASALCLLCARSQAGFTPIAGYGVIDLGLTGSAIAISPSGRFAVAQDSFGGGASVSVYDQVLPGRHLLGTILAPAGDVWKYIGAMTFLDDAHLAIGENGDMDTVYLGTLGGTSRLAPIGSVNNVSGLAVGFSGTLFALATNNPGSGAVLTLSGGAAHPFASGLGVGYMAGLGYHAGRLYAGDSNDPFFLGNPGQVYELDAGGAVSGTQSLSGGGGSGIVDLVFDSEGDMICSTGAALTQNGLPFGSFAGMFPFPTFLAYHGTRFEPGSGDGMLLVNGTFTDEGGIFAVVPVPEPALALPGLLILLAVKRGGKR